MDNDAERYRRYLAGDDNALTELIARYKDSLTLFLHTYIHNIFTAEELMEDVFFKLAIQKPHFSGKSSFKTWLFAIARNAAIDALRKEKRHPTIPLEAAAALTEQTAVEEAYFKEVQKLELHRAMESLRPEDKQVLYLLYFEDLSLKDVAAALGKTKKQTEDRAYRARKALKKRLEQEDFFNETY